MKRAKTKGKGNLERQVIMEGQVQRGKTEATAVQMADAAYLWGQVDVCHAQPLSMEPLPPLSCTRSHPHPSHQARDGLSSLWGGRRTLLDGWDTGSGGD